MQFLKKYAILILVLYFGEYKKHQKYRIINRIFIQDLHKETSSLLIVSQCYNLVRTLNNLDLLKTKTNETPETTVLQYFLLKISYSQNTCICPYIQS